MTFFFWLSTENLVKTRPTQKFWPLQKQILPPLELRSSCGTDMCVKKNCASPTRSLTARHCEKVSFVINGLTINGLVPTYVYITFSACQFKQVWCWDVDQMLYFTLEKHKKC